MELGWRWKVCIGLKRVVARAWLRARREGGITLERLKMGPWVRLLALLLTGCVTVGKSLELCVSQFPHLEKHDQKVPTSGAPEGHSRLSIQILVSAWSCLRAVRSSSVLCLGFSISLPVPLPLVLALSVKYNKYILKKKYLLHGVVEGLLRDIMVKSCEVLGSVLGAMWGCIW